VSNVPVGVYGLHAMSWTVVANTPPNVTIVPTSPTAIGVGGTVSMSATFTDPDVGDGPWAYTWAWGNGRVNGSWPAPGTYSASRRYLIARTYKVRLIVTDARGAADTSNAATVTVR
jgi:hypothetical protein